ncbi:MAG: amidohydrolase family protein [Gammaproteobacteria bacterium]|uniref:Amidohydrolase family protein n=1 Tax=SAR86 cluster bacterium TaxID=2030880 RepID=A0A520N0B5_9GAMM|nr:amidohydrolase [Gammaproteobacteria bacterium]MBA4729636.1 amidohydrolase family protein [SAR86 cluster bacterium]RZO26932.1 MAG: amidohydrolase family protein [SAR86 cluster bacterium]|tara:strand:+ start:3752 stop:5020 length:1269 start_codon:yes stop_codon:yes gene_type:complete
MKKLLLILLISSQAFSEKLIHVSEYIDGINDRVLKNASIVVGDDGRIKSISSGFKNSNGYQYIDLRDYMVMPGLMDMHVHFGQQNTSKADKPEKVEKEYSAIAAVKHARMTLDGGFTTVRQVGDSGFIAISLRDAITNGDAIGPRIFAAGKSLATTGGHADPTNGRAFGDYVYPDPESGVVNGPYEVFAGVRQRYKDGADGIKITVTGGVMSLAKSGDNPQFTQEEANAVVQAAKDYGFWVAVHAHGAEGMKRAIRAGVDSIEHGTYMDDEAMDLMIENGTYLVPTISAGEYVAEMSLIDGFFPEIVRPKARAVGPQIGGTFGKAYNRGVNIAFGTDVGVQAHGTNWKEFVYMVQYGMPMMKAIQSATMETAKLLRIEDDLGSLEVGKIADIIAVDGNPLEDPSLMKNVVFVMKEGEVFKQN